MIRAPIRYFGGKGNMLSQLYQHFPKDEYTTFVDAYGGSGVVLLNNQPRPVEIYNDLEQNVFSLYVTLSSSVLFEEFYKLCELAIYDQNIYNFYKTELKRQDLLIWQRAFMFWYVNRCSYNGTGAFNINKTIRRNMSKSISDFLSSIDFLPELHNRLQRVCVTNRNALDLIPLFDTKETFIYLDPPYEPSTRKSGKYKIDQNSEHHIKLVNTLNQLKNAKYLLSGYPNEIYHSLNANMVALDVSRVNNKNQTYYPEETLWKNY